MRERLPCGCLHDGVHWLLMCSACRTESDLTSARWAYERAHLHEKITVVRYHGVQPKPVTRVPLVRLVG